MKRNKSAFDFPSLGATIFSLGGDVRRTEGEIFIFNSQLNQKCHLYLSKYTMMNKNYLLILLFFPTLLFSQNILTLDEAIKIALEQNYGIQISELEQSAEAMQVYKSNAGFGPVVDWNANLNLAGSNVNIKFIDGREVSRWGRTIAPNTNITLGLPIYDGGRRQATYERLGLLSQYSTLQGKVIIQNTIVDIMEAYYNIIRQKETVDYLNTIIKYYEERLTITEQRWEFGKGAKLDFLQSKTDLNAQLSEIARAKNNLKNAKVLLNGILNREPQTEFQVIAIGTDRPEYALDDLKEKATTQNREIILLQKNLEISIKQEEELEAIRKPQVDLNASAGYAYSNNNAGFTLSNQNLAINAGLTARWNLYDGHHQKNQIAIAKVNSRIIEKQQESLEQQITNDLVLAFNQYQFDKELLEFEEENKSIAEENLAISLEKFRLGGSTILELNEAQRTLDTALNRLVNAQYNIKISELELLRLSGSLVE